MSAPPASGHPGTARRLVVVTLVVAAVLLAAVGVLLLSVSDPTLEPDYLRTSGLGDAGGTPFLGTVFVIAAVAALCAALALAVLARLRTRGRPGVPGAVLAGTAVVGLIAVVVGSVSVLRFSPVVGFVAFGPPTSLPARADSQVVVEVVGWPLRLPAVAMAVGLGALVSALLAAAVVALRWLARRHRAADAPVTVPGGWRARVLAVALVAFLAVAGGAALVALADTAPAPVSTLVSALACCVAAAAGAGLVALAAAGREPVSQT